MKNFVTLITVVFLSMAFIQATNHSSQAIENSIVQPPNMSISSIQRDMKKGIPCFMTGSFTVLKTPTSRDKGVAKTADISFRNALISSKGTYIQANPKAIRNDNNSMNPFRVYVPRDGGYQGNIDKRNIKVNWRTGSLNVIDKLSNVSVIYQKDSILIIGTMQKNGFTIGVSLAISKGDTYIIIFI